MCPRLCGSPPFWHRKQMYMLRDIMAGNYAFSSPIWNDVSDTPKDLVCSPGIDLFLFLFCYCVQLTTKWKSPFDLRVCM